MIPTNACGSLNARVRSAQYDEGVGATDPLATLDATPRRSDRSQGDSEQHAKDQRAQWPTADDPLLGASATMHLTHVSTHPVSVSPLGGAGGRA